MGIILTILATLLAALVEWYIKYEKDKTFYNNEFLKLEHRLEEMQEDFLIQDNELLVDIAGRTHKFNKNDSVEERITMNKNEIQQKLKRFDRLLERATEYKY